MTDQPSETQEAEKTRDRNIVRLARSSEKEHRQEAIQHLWTLSHQRWIEKRIEERLLSAGLLDPDVWDDFDRRVENANFSSLWMHVVTSIYSVDRIADALAAFDPEKGSLGRWLQTRVYMVIHGWLRDRRLTAGVARTVSTDEELPGDDLIDEPCRSFDEALLTLTATQRACQTLQVVPFRDLTDLDRDAIQREGEQNGLQPLEIERRVDRLIECNRWDASATQRYLELQVKLNAAFTGVEKAEAECRYWREMLTRHGLSDREISELRVIAEQQTLEQIEDAVQAEKVYVVRDGVRQVQNRKLYSQIRFQLWSRRLVKRRQALENAREKFQKSGGDKAATVIGTSDGLSSGGTELVLRPVPNPEIAECLNKTVQSVHSALSAAKKRLRQAGFRPPAEGDDDSDGDSTRSTSSPPAPSS